MSSQREADSIPNTVTIELRFGQVNYGWLLIIVTAAAPNNFQSQLGHMCEYTQKAQKCCYKGYRTKNVQKDEAPVYHLHFIDALTVSWIWVAALLSQCCHQASSLKDLLH